MRAILLIGEDDTLLQTRAAVLRKVGAEVLLTNAAGALSTLAERIIDMVVLCHSLSEEQQYGLTSAVRTGWPQARMLLVTTHKDAGDVDDRVSVDATSPTDPERLIACARHLLMQVPPVETSGTRSLHAAQA